MSFIPENLVIWVSATYILRKLVSHFIQDWMISNLICQLHNVTSSQFIQSILDFFLQYFSPLHTIKDVSWTAKLYKFFYFRGLISFFFSQGWMKYMPKSGMKCMSSSHELLLWVKIWCSSKASAITCNQGNILEEYSRSSILRVSVPSKDQWKRKNGLYDGSQCRSNAIPPILGVIVYRSNGQKLIVVRFCNFAGLCLILTHPVLRVLFRFSLGIVWEPVFGLPHCIFQSNVASFFRLMAVIGEGICWT